MARLPIISWIGNAAAVLTGAWGVVSRQAKDARCSRQTACEHAEKVEAAVRDAAGGGPSRGQLQEQLRQQAAEIAALKKRLEGAAEFPEQEQQRFAATATAMGLSYGQARELLEIVVKKTTTRPRWRARFFSFHKHIENGRVRSFFVDRMVFSFEWNLVCPKFILRALPGLGAKQISAAHCWPT